ncbi:MAG: hypothetical protein COB36_12405 [Alphaproteobacteria bacterium]|nr:MAG: hypothetical protein COB36_12405 [Alphaproteobacteria bacterium]
MPISKLLATALLTLLVFLPSISLAKDETTDTLPISGLLISIEYEDEEPRKYEPRLKFLIDRAYVEYTELFNGPALKVNGKPYTHLKLKISHGFYGEADPETIELGLSDAKLFGFYNWEMMVLHEVLHFWNAETFRYTDDQEQWFNEGVTEYLTFRLAAKIGIIPEDEVISSFAKPISTYLSAKGIGSISLREAASTDELKRQHYFLVYHGGFVTGMVLDHQIRVNSKGKKNLTDLMREVYASNSRHCPYSQSSLIRSLYKSTSQDHSKFFENYVDGTEIIPVGRYFDIGKLGFSQAFNIEIKDPKQQVLLDMLTFERLETTQGNSEVTSER